MNACLSCRRVKMRCRPGRDEGSKCERCARKTLDCVFQEHRRGRKPGTRISKKSKSMNSTIQDSVTVCADGTLSEAQEPSGLQPSELLNCDAMRGKFSLQNILGPKNPQDVSSNKELPAVPAGDVIRAGLVSRSIAEFLFESFMNILNPYISQLDPILHTFAYVRHKSSFLLSSVLAAAAKMFNPGLYKSLHKHAEDLFVENFRMGTKSTETAQAIMVLTYWKEPEDTRSWVTLGYVIRMCIDLGWHKLVPRSPQDRELLSEKELREARNIERTWYVLFVYDRSMSLQTGKPWMIERNRFIESIESWAKDPTATQNDVLLSAFVTLRLLTSEVFKMLGSRREVNSFQNIDSFLRILSHRIDEWEEKWLQSCANEEESCHPFLIRFYGTHLRLQLYSLPLQEVLGSRYHDITYNLEALWASYSSAIEMLKLVSGFSLRLYYAQDSIHVMIAYSAAFLIKLLLSAPKSIVREIEPATVDTIRTAATVFSNQNAPPGSSCFLQARFLINVISNFDDIRKGQSTDNDLPSSSHTLSTGQSRAYEQGRCDSAPRHQQELVQSDIAPYQTPTTSRDTPSAPSPLVTGNDSISPYTAALSQSEKIDCVFIDNDAWDSVFTSAGFSIQEGFFFS